VPAAGGQSLEERVARGLLVQMERLRIDSAANVSIRSLSIRNRPEPKVCPTANSSRYRSLVFIISRSRVMLLSNSSWLGAAFLGGVSFGSTQAGQPGRAPTRTAHPILPLNQGNHARSAKAMGFSALC
jgi:hypothetical protein